MTFQEFRTVSVIALLVLPWVFDAQELNSTLHSTFYGVQFAYDGENVTFTCMARGSTVIAWSSNDYIGTHLRLEFASVEPVGITRSASRSGTVAQLINSTTEDGAIVLVSRLNILVVSTFQISSITCHNIGMDTTNTVSFQMADDASVTCNKPAVCPGEIVICSCTTGHSSIIAWTSSQLIGDDGSRLEFASVQPVMTRQNASSSNAFAVLAGSSVVNGIVVLESELTFIASESSANILECLNVIRQTSKPIIIPISKNCETLSTTIVDSSTTEIFVTTTEFDPITTSSSASIGVVLAATTSALVAVAIIPVIIVIAYVLCMKRRRFVPTGRVKKDWPYLGEPYKESKYVRNNTSDDDEECSKPFSEEKHVRPVRETTFGSQPNNSITRSFGVMEGTHSIVQRSSEKGSHKTRANPVNETEVRSVIKSCVRVKGFDEMEHRIPLEEGLPAHPVEESEVGSVNNSQAVMVEQKEELQKAKMMIVGARAEIIKDEQLQDLSLTLRKELEEKDEQIDDLRRELEEKTEQTKALQMDQKRKQAVIIDQKKKFEKSDEQLRYLRRELEEKKDEVRQKTLLLELELSEQNEQQRELRQKILHLEMKLSEEKTKMGKIEMSLQSSEISLIEKDQQIERFQKRENEMVQRHSEENERRGDHLRDEKDLPMKAAQGGKDRAEVVQDLLNHSEMLQEQIDGLEEDLGKNVSKPDTGMLQDVVDYLKEELGNRDSKAAQAEKHNEEVVDNVLMRTWGLRGEVADLKEDKDGKMACIKSDLEDFMIDITKQEKYDYGCNLNKLE